MRIVIIGGVAGGMSAAARLRRLSEETEIIVLDKGPYVSFANCGLPYYLSGEIANREDLIVQSTRQLKKRFKIDVRTETTVTEINSDNHQITTVHHGLSKTITYDKLILSPGSVADKPNIPGMGSADYVYALRSIPDVDKIMAQLSQTPTRVAIIGAGSIGIEVAENLIKRGLSVMLIDAGSQVLPFMDPEMAALVSHELSEHSVTLKLNTQIEKIDRHQLTLNDGSQIKADLVISAVGVRPNTALAQAAGIKTGELGGIIVDKHYQTSQPDVYAVGDAILVKQLLTGQLVSIPLASPANRQGREVADVIMGLPRENRGGIGTAIVRAFDVAAAATGLNVAQLKRAGINYQAVHTTGQNHAAFYPGGKPLSMKLLFEPQTGKLLGAQAVGEKSVDKQIDILSVAIKSGMTVFDLPEFELSYAPPFGSAKDPVNMIGYAASNLVEGLSDNLQFDQLEGAIKDGAYLIDVRTPGELKRDGKLPGSTNIPLDDLRDHLAEIPKDRLIIVSCRSGQRSYLAERILKNNGFKVKNLDGAFLVYSTAYPERIEH